MDLLNLDLKTILKYATSAFIKVYGEEYQSIIEKRISDAIYIFYQNPDSLNFYLNYLKKCKQNELSIKFLEKIGITILADNKDCTKDLSLDLARILAGFIGNENAAFNKECAMSHAPLLAFLKGNSAAKLENKLRLINYMRGLDKEPITEENLEQFIKTEEYAKILKEINHCLKIYQELLSEYQNWEATLEPYKEYIKKEKQKRKIVLDKIKLKMLNLILGIMPNFMREIIIKKPLEEQLKILLDDSQRCEPNLNAFSEENILKLKNNPSSNWMLIRKQLIYLRGFGVETPSFNDIIEDIDGYLKFLNQSWVKQFILSGFIRMIDYDCQSIYEREMGNYYLDKNDKLAIIRGMLCSTMDNDGISVTGVTKGDNISIVMLYTFSPKYQGHQFFAFLHEIGHVIDYDYNGCGFEVYDNNMRNPYNQSCRLYEVFNETINDILASEVIDILNQQNIYLIEPKECTSLNQKHMNTFNLTRDLLMPLLKKFRNQVIRAKITANPDELIRYIGKENFEALVDVVNKVQHLCSQAIIPTKTGMMTEDIYCEYKEQLERLEQIYNSIDVYFENITSSQKLKKLES